MGPLCEKVGKSSKAKRKFWISNTTKYKHANSSYFLSAEETEGKNISRQQEKMKCLKIISSNAYVFPSPLSFNAQFNHRTLSLRRETIIIVQFPIKKFLSLYHLKT